MDVRHLTQHWSKCSIHIIIATCLLLLLLNYSQLPTFHHRTNGLAGTFATSSGDASAGNETLGFNAILALSRGTPWRVDGLHAAAAASGIQVLVPAQPQWSEPFVKAFKDFGPVEAHGAAMAWLGHIDLLKYVIQNRWGSALILEDDMDWSVNVRKQTPKVATAVLKLTKEWAGKETPYGTGWDVLWIGHCGDPPDLKEPHVIYADDTATPLNMYHAIDRWVTRVIDPNQRVVHFSRNPVCTFAYAVSFQGAKHTLAEASLGHGGAFDLMLLDACKEGRLKCITVNPGLFDPYTPADGAESEVRAGDDGKVFESHVGSGMGKTFNVLRSARCKGLFGKTCFPEDVVASE